VNNPLPSVKLISFNDRTEPFQLEARYAAHERLPAGTETVIGRFIVSGMPPKQDGKKAAKIKVRVKLNLHGVLTVTNAQLLEEVDEPSASPPPQQAPTAQPMDTTAETAGAAAGGASAEAPKAGAAEGEKMEDEPKKEPSAEPSASPSAAESKKKIKRSDLKVESWFVGGLDQQTLNAFFEKEANMATQVTKTQQLYPSVAFVPSSVDDSFRV
jgi:heat shock protein 4